MNDTTQEMVNYRISKAYLTLKEVEFLIQNKFYNTAISRLYYSCFYAVNAVLSLLGFSAKTHKGTMVLLHQHVVSKGIITHEQSKFFSTLFQARQENDYDDFVEPDPSTLPDWQKQAKDFIDTINSYISKEVR